MKSLFSSYMLVFLVVTLSIGMTSCNSHTGNRGLLEPGSQRIVCFGDSTTERDDARGLCYCLNLRNELSSYAITGSVINAGIGGNNTNGAMGRFNRDVLAHDPNLVIIQFGINDSSVDVWRNATESRISLSKFISNMTYMTQTLKAQGRKVILMTTNAMSWTQELLGLYGQHPYNSDDRWGFNTVIVNYNQAVCDLAKAENVPLVDVYQMYVDYDAVEGQDFANLLADGMHPNTAGHRLTTDRLIKVITGN